MKKYYIEILRIIAIIFVIYNHTRTIGFELFYVTDEKISYLLSYVMYPLCKIAVPIFLMISGVNLLSKNETIKILFKKRILKHSFIILLFGTFQFLRYARVNKVSVSLASWFSSIYSNPLLETYWFLYMYLGFMLILPILRKLVVSMEKKEYLYIFFYYISFNVLTLIGYFSGYFINPHVLSLSNVLFYPIIGYGIDKYNVEIKKSICIIITITTQLLFLVLGWLYSIMHPDNYNGFVNVIQLGTPIIACGIFCIIKELCKGKGNKIIFSIGSTVFGIYLIEDIVRNQIEKILIKLDLVNKMNDFVVAILFVFAIFICSMIIIYTLKLLLIFINDFKGEKSEKDT